MIFIKHRVNQIKDVCTLNPTWGAEIDIRSRIDGSLYLAHDPFAEGDDFDHWLIEYKKHGIMGPLILNTKEDGLESYCLERLSAHGVKNYFFLDTTIPTLVKWTLKKNLPNFAVRFSAYEPLSSVMAFAKKASWVWVDCFDGIPPDPRDVAELKKFFRICLVSPELQLGMTADLARQIRDFSPVLSMLDAVCTKNPDLWPKDSSSSRAS